MEEYDFILAWPDDMSSLTISAQNDPAVQHLESYFDDVQGTVVVTTWETAFPFLTHVARHGWRIG